MGLEDRERYVGVKGFCLFEFIYDLVGSRSRGCLVGGCRVS